MKEKFYGFKYSDHLSEIKIARIIFCCSSTIDQESIFEILSLELIHLILLQCGNNEIVKEYKGRSILHIDSVIIDFNMLHRIIDYAIRKETIGKPKSQFVNYLLKQS